MVLLGFICGWLGAFFFGSYFAQPLREPLRFRCYLLPSLVLGFLSAWRTG